MHFFSAPQHFWGSCSQSPWSPGPTNYFLFPLLDPSHQHLSLLKYTLKKRNSKNYPAHLHPLHSHLLPNVNLPHKYFPIHIFFGIQIYKFKCLTLLPLWEVIWVSKIQRVRNWTHPLLTPLLKPAAHALSQWKASLLSNQFPKRETAASSLSPSLWKPTTFQHAPCQPNCFSSAQAEAISCLNFTGTALWISLQIWSCHSAA